MNIMNFKFKFALVLTGISLLTSCSLLSPVKSDSQSAYMLTALPTNVPIKRTRPITILVPTPDIKPAYNTTQMAYTVKPYQIAYFGINHWAETPAQMLQPLLVQTLQNTHYFHAVVVPPYMGRYEYVISTQILRLQQDFTHCHHPFVDLRVRVQISKMSTNQVIATREFIVHEPMHQISPYAGVIAANRATQKLLQEIAEFALTNI